MYVLRIYFKYVVDVLYVLYIIEHFDYPNSYFLGLGVLFKVKVKNSLP